MTGQRMLLHLWLVMMVILTGCASAKPVSNGSQIDLPDPGVAVVVWGNHAGASGEVVTLLQQRGYRIGFNPAGFVWHYRRSTVRAYLKQQRGYGEAEAILVRKHPEYFNSLGHGLWHGRITRRESSASSSAATSSTTASSAPGCSRPCTSPRLR